MSDYTLLLAVYGALISTAALLWNIIRYYRSKKGKLKITATVRTQLLVSNQVKSSDWIDVLTIEIVNVSERSRYIRHIRFEIDRKEKRYMDFLEFQKPIQYPIELEPGAQFSHTYTHSNLQGNNLDSIKSNKVRLFVKDTHGKFHRSRWYKAKDLFLLS